MVRVLAGVLILVAAVAAQETTKHSSEDGVASLELPKRWVVTTKKSVDDQIRLRMWIKIPGEEDSVMVELYTIVGAGLTARGQAAYELEHQIKRYPDPVGKYGHEPMPHVELKFKDEGNQTFVLIFKHERCRGVHVGFTCKERLFPKIRDAAFAAAATARTTLPRWPAVTGTFEDTVIGDVVYRAGVGVTKKQVSAVRKRLLKVSKRFEKLHTKIVRPKDEPLLVFVVATRRKALELVEKPTKYGHWGHLGGRRVIVTAWKRGNKISANDFAHEAHQVFLEETYGCHWPDWLYVGDSRVYRAELACGKRAPHVPGWFLKDFKGITQTLDSLAHSGLSGVDWDRAVSEGAGYVIFFRHGPGKYRKAFGAFLAEFRETGDHDKAMQHFRAFDLDELRQTAQAYLARKLKSD